jgi:hypothetical protein
MKSNKPECVKQLSITVSRFLKLKDDLKKHQQAGRKMREDIKEEEASLFELMKTSGYTECVANDTTIKISSYKRQPTVSLKTMLPLVQRVFDASPEHMQMLEDEVKEFRSTNASEVNRVQCRTKRARTPRAAPAKAVTAAAAASLSSALMSY